MRRYILLLLSLLVAANLWAQEPAEGSAESADVEATDVTDATDATATTAGENIEVLSAEQLWARANEAYNGGNYAEALADYEVILAQGKHSAALYYNTANAYFKMGQLGRAILYYNRAQRLSPADEDIRHNLEYAESLTKDSIEEIPEFILTTWVRAVRGVMSSTAWTVVSLVLLSVALAMALMFLLSQRIAWRKVGFYVMTIAAVLFVATTLFAISERREIVNSREAIIMNSAVSIKSSPDRAATELFVLHEGTKVFVGEVLGGWAEVRISDGRKGWIEESRIEKI